MLRGMLSPATANPNMLAQAVAARQSQQRNMLSGPTTGAEFAQNVGMVPGLGLLGVGGDIAQYIDRPETRGWLPYALTAAGALPFLGALSRMAGPMPRGLLQSQAGAIYYRGENVGNRGGNFYTPEKEWARQFTQSGLDKEIRSANIDEKLIFNPKTPVYAGDPDAVDAAIAKARESGYKAVRLDEGKNEPMSVFVFNKTAIK